MCSFVTNIFWRYPHFSFEPSPPVVLVTLSPKRIVTEDLAWAPEPYFARFGVVRVFPRGWESPSKVQKTNTVACHDDASRWVGRKRMRELSRNHSGKRPVDDNAQSSQDQWKNSKESRDIEKFLKQLRTDRKGEYDASGLCKRDADQFGRGPG